MKLSIVITTCNRPKKVIELIDQLIMLIDSDITIFLIDSSEELNLQIPKKYGINYIHTLHKNQPYQRYLGYLSSESELIVFLDDDMEIIDKMFLSKVRDLFVDTSLSAVAINFANKSERTSLSLMPESTFFRHKNIVKKIKNFLTGYPELKPGKYGLCGNRGRQPEGGGFTEWVSGGAFAARRLDLFQNFNFQLFDIFERGLGMGEDGIIGYGLSKRGKLIYYDELLFLHNDQQDSIYTLNIFNYARRVAFSRLYLSSEKTRLDKGCLSIARMHYHYYMFWRILGLVVNYFLNRSKNREDLLLGSLSGWRLAAGFRFDNELIRTAFWKTEAFKDMSK